MGNSNSSKMLGLVLAIVGFVLLVGGVIGMFFSGGLTLCCSPFGLILMALGVFLSLKPQ